MPTADLQDLRSPCDHPLPSLTSLFLHVQRGPGGCLSTSASGKRPTAASSEPQWQENPGGHKASLAWLAQPSLRPSCQGSRQQEQLSILGSGGNLTSLPL